MYFVLKYFAIMSTGSNNKSLINSLGISFHLLMRPETLKWRTGKTVKLSICNMSMNVCRLRLIVQMFLSRSRSRGGQGSVRDTAGTLPESYYLASCRARTKLPLILARLRHNYRDMHFTQLF